MDCGREGDLQGKVSAAPEELLCNSGEFGSEERGGLCQVLLLEQKDGELQATVAKGQAEDAQQQEPAEVGPDPSALHSRRDDDGCDHKTAT